MRSIEPVTAEGKRVHASRDENADLFRGAIGGYGALGVTTGAELDLAENVRVGRAAMVQGFRLADRRPNPALLDRRRIRPNLVPQG